MNGAIAALVGAELSKNIDMRVAEMAAAVAARYGTSSRAVLFYGSCLREQQLDGLMLDFYLIVSDYRTAYDKRWLAWANRLIPPNVFPFINKGLSAKYAVLSEADFHQLCSDRADNVSVWARFAQPARLAWVADETVRASITEAIAQAVPTLLRQAWPCVPVAERESWRAVFEYGFSMTYKAELRAERKSRSDSLVDSDPSYYRAMFDAALADGVISMEIVSTEQEERIAKRRWRRLQGRGKWLSVARLVKASFTFAGGIDYLAWKINRHAGTAIVITPWQRRHPLVAALMLLPRLFASRAIG